MIVARAVRRATAPGAPTLRNSVLAREAPAWIDPMAMSSSRTGTTGERGDARGMGIGVEECGQRAGPYVSQFRTRSLHGPTSSTMLTGGDLARRQYFPGLSGQLGKAAPEKAAPGAHHESPGCRGFGLPAARGTRRGARCCGR